MKNIGRKTYSLRAEAENYWNNGDYNNASKKYHETINLAQSFQRLEDVEFLNVKYYLSMIAIGNNNQEFYIDKLISSINSLIHISIDDRIKDKLLPYRRYFLSVSLYYKEKVADAICLEDEIRQLAQGRCKLDYITEFVIKLTHLKSQKTKNKKQYQDIFHFIETANLPLEIKTELQHFLSILIDGKNDNFFFGNIFEKHIILPLGKIMKDVSTTASLKKQIAEIDKVRRGETIKWINVILSVILFVPSIALCLIMYFMNSDILYGVIIPVLIGIIFFEKKWLSSAKWILWLLLLIIIMITTVYFILFKHEVNFINLQQMIM